MQSNFLHKFWSFIVLCIHVTLDHLCMHKMWQFNSAFCLIIISLLYHYMEFIWSFPFSVHIHFLFDVSNLLWVEIFWLNRCPA